MIIVQIMLVVLTGSIQLVITHYLLMELFSISRVPRRHHHELLVLLEPVQSRFLQVVVRLLSFLVMQIVFKQLSTRLQKIYNHQRVQLITIQIFLQVQN